MKAPHLERKLAAILAADVEGYSRLMHSDEERTLATLTAHRAIVDTLIAAANGLIFSTAGDSVLAEFSSVVDAFNCAVAIQQALWHANQKLPKDQRMNLRIGINVGDVLIKNGDVFGDGVNIAARLESLADVGGICVTRAVRDHLRDRVDTTFEDIGEHSVKNISRPIHVFKALIDVGINAESALVKLPVAPPISEPAGSPAHLANAGPEPNRVELAFWQSLQTKDDLGEYRIYLERYPDGQFVDLAKARLRSGENVPEPQVEVTFWESVRDSNSEEMVQAYIDRYPNGEFVSLANLILTDLRSRSG